MKFMLLIAEITSGKKGAKRNVLTLGFIVIYTFISILYICGLLFYGQRAFGAKTLEQSTKIYILYLFSIIIIHIWIYASIKIKQHYDIIHDFCNREVYEVMWHKYEHWFNIWPTPKEEARKGENLFKLFYMAGWLVFVIICTICIFKMRIYEFFSFETPEMILANMWLAGGLVLLAISIILNFFSFYVSMMFTYFVRNISNTPEIFDHNRIKPSATKEYHGLIHISSRNAIAFFFESMLYIILLVLTIKIDPIIFTDSNKAYFMVLITGVLLLCVFSFLSVFLLPKIFLSRLLRRWKWKMIDEIEEKKSGLVSSDELEDYEKRLDIIYKDELPLVKTEMIVAVCAVIVDVVSICIQLP